MDNTETKQVRILKQTEFEENRRRVYIMFKLIVVLIFVE